MPKILLSSTLTPNTTKTRRPTMPRQRSLSHSKRVTFSDENKTCASQKDSLKKALSNAHSGTESIAQLERVSSQSASQPLTQASDLLSGVKDMQSLTCRLNHLRIPGVQKAEPIITPADDDILMKENFPVTLGEAVRLQAQVHSTKHPPITPTIAPPPTGILESDKTPWRPLTAFNVSERFPSWTTTKDWLQSHTQNALLENGTQNPGSETNKSQVSKWPTSSVHATSPYEMELALLRVERLRLEEDIRMEAQRQENLQETRGPQPKWFELKSPQFHYELHKNASLVNDAATGNREWNGILDYRQDLLQKTQQFHSVLAPYKPYSKLLYSEAFS